MFIINTNAKNLKPIRYRKHQGQLPTYCTFTKFHYLINFTIFTDHEDALNLICMKYYEIDIIL